MSKLMLNEREPYSQKIKNSRSSKVPAGATESHSRESESAVGVQKLYGDQTEIDQNRHSALS